MDNEAKKFKSVISSIKKKQRGFDWKTYVSPVSDEILERINADPSLYCLTTFNLHPCLPPCEFMGDPKDWDEKGIRLLGAYRLSTEGRKRLAGIVHWGMVYERGIVSEEYQAKRYSRSFVGADSILARLLDWFFLQNRIPFRNDDFFLQVDCKRQECGLYIHPDLATYFNDYFLPLLWVCSYSHLAVVAWVDYKCNRMPQSVVRELREHAYSFFSPPNSTEKTIFFKSMALSRRLPVIERLREHMETMFGLLMRSFEGEFRVFRESFWSKRSELILRYKEVLEIDPIEDEKYRGFDSFEESFEYHSGPFSETPPFILQYIKSLCLYGQANEMNESPAALGDVLSGYCEQQPTNTEWVLVGEAARRLDIERRTLARYRAAGTKPVKEKPRRDAQGNIWRYTNRGKQQITEYLLPCE